MSVNVCSDTKCILVPIKLLVVRLPRLRLPGVILGGDTKMSAPGVTHPSYATERESERDRETERGRETERRIEIERERERGR